MGLKRRPPEGNVRRVESKGTNYRGEIVNKAGRQVQYESRGAWALILRLDHDRDVLDYCSQPEQFEFTDRKGTLLTYVPALKTWTRDGTVEIITISSTTQLAQPDIRLREKAVRESCQTRGFRYIVHTERTLPQPTEEANLWALSAFRPTIYANQEVACAAFATLNGAGKVLLDSFAARTAQNLQLPKPQVTNALLHMLWHDQITTDLGRLLFFSGSLAPRVQIWSESEESE